MLLLPALLLCLPLAAQSPWEVLFDGGDTSAWRTATTETFPSSSWVVENGLLRTIPDPVFAQDLWTRHKYRDFELVFEWRVDGAPILRQLCLRCTTEGQSACKSLRINGAGGGGRTI